MKKLITIIKSFFENIFIFDVKEKCISDMEKLGYPINTFNSTDEECLKNDFERVFKNDKAL